MIIPTFDEAIVITTSIPFIIAVILTWAIPLLIYLFFGAVTHAKTSDGRKLKSVVMQNSNFWIGFIIYFFIQSALDILLIYPVWLYLFE